MFQVRIHGRGGQGVVTAAELLSVAAFFDGLQAQAFPSFGSGRTGTPVVASCRIDDAPIRLWDPVSEPDAVIIEDVTLLHQVAVFEGLRPNGYVLLNTTRTWTELGLADFCSTFEPDHLATLPASEIAQSNTGRPVPNSSLIGGLAAMTGIVSLGAIERAIRDRFHGAVAVHNVLAAREAYRCLAPTGPVTAMPSGTFVPRPDQPRGARAESVPDGDDRPYRLANRPRIDEGAQWRPSPARWGRCLGRQA